MWAEEVGIGDMRLPPDQFWALTVREFHLKHAAFSRDRDWQRSLIFELAAMVSPRADKKMLAQLHRGVHQLRRYPIKRWLCPDAPKS